MKSLKILLVTAALVILWVGQAMAQTVYLYDVTPEYTIEGLEPIIIETESNSDWTKEDTARQLAFTMLAVIDWRQTVTITIAQNNLVVDDSVITINSDEPSYKFQEMNPLLGSHPSLSQINTYFLICIPGNHLIAKSIKSKFWRTIWQTASFGLESYCVSNNIKLKITL